MSYLEKHLIFSTVVGFGSKKTYIYQIRARQKAKGLSSRGQGEPGQCKKTLYSKKMGINIYTYISYTHHIRLQQIFVCMYICGVCACVHVCTHVFVCSQLWRPRVD